MDKLNIQIVRKYFGMNICDAARMLKISESLLKKFMHKNGASKWPSRKINSVKNIIAILYCKEQNLDENNTCERNSIIDEIVSNKLILVKLIKESSIKLSNLISKNTLKEYSKIKLKILKNTDATTQYKSNLKKIDKECEIIIESVNMTTNANQNATITINNERNCKREREDSIEKLNQNYKFQKIESELSEQTYLFVHSQFNSNELADFDDSLTLNRSIDLANSLSSNKFTDLELLSNVSISSKPKVPPATENTSSIEKLTEEEKIALSCLSVDLNHYYTFEKFTKFKNSLPQLNIRDFFNKLPINNVS